eukprot:7832346-Karenia_brevis.AAC.1
MLRSARHILLHRGSPLKLCKYCNEANDDESWHHGDLGDMLQGSKMSKRVRHPLPHRGSASAHAPQIFWSSQS